MFVRDTILNRLKRGCETTSYPATPAPPLPDQHGGVLQIDPTKCKSSCEKCQKVCPTEAISRSPKCNVILDLGRCLFCSECVSACDQAAITQTGDHRMAVRHRNDLALGEGNKQLRLADALEEKLRRLFGRSLKLRQVSAGGCNACEADTNVLGTIGWDLGRFGIQFVASPRHADGILITGPVSKNMELALKKTYDAVPDPRIVIAVGACAISGGPFIGSPETLNGAESIVPVDLFIPGCPPHPITILDGLLRLIGRLQDK